jgi:signal transduction histidine kinase
MTFAITESDRGYDPIDLLFAEAVVNQVAVVSDNARLYRAAETAREAAEAANSAKDQFLSTLSYELRTPLNAIYGWATMLERGQLGEEQARRALQIILRNVNAQVRLIDDLLDLARVASGKLGGPAGGPTAVWGSGSRSCAISSSSTAGSSLPRVPGKGVARPSWSSCP